MLSTFRSGFYFLRYTFNPTLASSCPGMTTLPSVEAIMIVFPEEEGPNSFDRSTLIVRVFPSTVISTFFISYVIGLLKFLKGFSVIPYQTQLQYKKAHLYTLNMGIKRCFIFTLSNLGYTNSVVPNLIPLFPDLQQIPKYLPPKETDYTAT